jgi:hypothetical protein
MAGDLGRALGDLPLEDARRVAVGLRLERDFDEGTFGGAVQEVERGLRLKGSRKRDDGLSFYVLYDDGDREDLGAETLAGLLTRPACAQALRRLAKLVPRPAPAGADAADAADAAPPPAKRGRRESGPPSGSQAAADAALEATPTQGDGAVAAADAARRGRQTHLTDEAQHGAERRCPASAGGGADATDPRGAAPTARSRLGAPPAPAVEDAPPRVDGARVVGLPGHLRRVELVDFMCHRHLALDFAPHVTLISGANGSGKSATLQALQCALGARATRTGRATSAKGFVREGAAEAIVRVTLWNCPYKGHDAFQHELYGDEITVERRIGASGQGSTWALKDALGRRVGQRRADLDALLCTLALNAENPVTVMTQDTARSFLAGSSAGAPPPLPTRSLCLPQPQPRPLAHAVIYTLSLSTLLFLPPPPRSRRP